MRPTQGAEQRRIWIQQAGPRAVGEHRVGAGAQQEHPLHGGDRLVHRPGGGERSPVAALAELRAAMLGDLRERVVLGQHQPGVGLVVAQDDVEARLEALDQVGFEQQRLGLGVGGDHLHRDGFVDHPPQPFVEAAELGVGGDPLLQAARLADVEGVALGIEHAIDARARRHGGQRLLDHATPMMARRLSLMAVKFRLLRGSSARSSGNPPNLWISLWVRLGRKCVKAARNPGFRTGLPVFRATSKALISLNLHLRSCHAISIMPACRCSY